MTWIVEKAPASFTLSSAPSLQTAECRTVCFSDCDRAADINRAISGKLVSGGGSSRSLSTQTSTGVAEFAVIILELGRLFEKLWLVTPG